MLWFDLSSRDQQPPVSPQLREAEPHGPPAQPQDPAELHRPTAQPGGDRTQRLCQPAQPVCQPAQPDSPPEPCDPAARPSTSDLHPREQVRHHLEGFHVTEHNKPF